MVGESEQALFSRYIPNCKRICKRQLFSRSSERVIQLGDIETEVQGSAAVVNSKQEYRSETYEDSGLKTLRLRWYRGRWTIFRETWKPLPDQG